jgi:hypothetical protein
VTEEDRKARIVALLEERRGYEQRGLKERVEAVNRELRRLGAEGAPPAARAERRPSRRASGERR